MNHLQNSKVELYGLAYSCPYLERQVDCPFKQVEHLSFGEKVKWIDNLSEEEKKQFLITIGIVL